MPERTRIERHVMEHYSVDDGEQYQCSICGYYDEDNAGPPEDDGYDGDYRKVDEFIEAEARARSNR